MLVEVKLPDFMTPVKAHIQRNKKAYYIGGLVVVAGVTYYLTRRTGLRGELSTNKVQAAPSNTASIFSFGNKQSNVVTIVNRANHGRPGNMVRSIDLDKNFASQRETARTFGISETVLSNHLNGHIPNANGYMFERMEA